MSFVEPDPTYSTTQLRRTPSWGPQVQYSQPPIDLYSDNSYEADRRAQQSANAWGVILVSANVVFAGLVFTGMWWSGNTILLSILISAFYYAGTTLAALAFMSGQIRYLWETMLYFMLERRRLRALERATERDFDLRMKQEQTRQLELAIMQVQVPHAPQLALAPFGETKSFVAPAQETQATYPALPDEAHEAVRWLRKLFDASGDPDAREVLADGRLRHATIGGAKAGGSRAARTWLEEQRILKAVNGGHALNLQHFNSWDAVLLHLRKSYIF